MTAVANRKKPDQSWLQTKDLLNASTFFLVHRCPTVFSIKNENGESFRLTLGNPHTCTCRTDLCVHFLFVMIKVLRISDENPLCWQLCFTDAEIESILSGSVNSNPRHVVRRGFISRRDNSLIIPPKVLPSSSNVIRQPIDDNSENICSICQDEMSVGQALTWCRTGCGNNLHAKCMKMFAQFKVTNNQSVSCPLCREEWGAEAMQVISEDCRGAVSSKHCTATVRCYSCTLPVRGTFFRCIQCSQESIRMSIPVTSTTSQQVSAVVDARAPAKCSSAMDFCQRCFPSMGREHYYHCFVSSDAATSSATDVVWIPHRHPRSLPHSLDSGALEDLQNRELSAEDYDTLLGLDRGGQIPLPNHLVSSLPPLPTSTPVLPSCCFCGIHLDSDVSARSLLCAHAAHDVCLLAAVGSALSDGCAALTSVRCGITACKRVIFPGLSRRKPRKKIETEPPVIADPIPDTIADSASRGMKPFGISGVAVRSSASVGSIVVPRGAGTTAGHRRPPRMRRDLAAASSAAKTERMVETARLSGFVLRSSSSSSSFPQHETLPSDAVGTRSRVSRDLVQDDNRRTAIPAAATSATTVAKDRLRVSPIRRPSSITNRESVAIAAVRLPSNFAANSDTSTAEDVTDGLMVSGGCGPIPEVRVRSYGGGHVGRLVRLRGRAQATDSTPLTPKLEELGDCLAVCRY